MLDRRAATHGDAQALVFRAPETGIDRAWTYGELQDEAIACARALIGLGVAKGDKVCRSPLPNSPDWIILENALAKIGAVLVTVNPAYRETELRYLLENGDVHTLFSAARFRGFSVADLIGRLVPESAAATAAGSIAHRAFPMLRQLVLHGRQCPGALTMAQFPGSGAGSSAKAGRNSGKPPSPRWTRCRQIHIPAARQGAPKGVVLSHRSTLNNAIMNRCPQRPFRSRPHAQPHAVVSYRRLRLQCLGCWLQEQRLSPCPPSNARRALELMESERATILNGAPTMFIRMMDIMEEDARDGRIYDLSAFKTCFTGGTTILPAHMQQVKEKMGGGSPCDLRQ